MHVTAVTHPPSPPPPLAPRHTHRMPSTETTMDTRVPDVRASSCFSSFWGSGALPLLLVRVPVLSSFGLTVSVLFALSSGASELV